MKTFLALKLSQISGRVQVYQSVSRIESANTSDPVSR